MILLPLKTWEFALLQLRTSPRVLCTLSLRKIWITFLSDSPLWTLKEQLDFSTSTPFPLLTYTNPVSSIFFFFYVTSSSSLWNPNRFLLDLVHYWEGGKLDAEFQMCPPSRNQFPWPAGCAHNTAQPLVSFTAGSWHCSWMELDVVLMIWRRLLLKVKSFRNF